MEKDWSAEAETTISDSRPKTILIVEDEAPIRRLLQDLLEDHYQLLIAEDGAGGLQLARQHAGQFDLLLSDVVMPNMNGVELARAVQSEQPHVKVLLISAYYQGMLVLEHGAGWNFLAKPFVAKALLEAIEKALRRGVIT